MLRYTGILVWAYRYTVPRALYRSIPIYRYIVTPLMDSLIQFYVPFKIISARENGRTPRKTTWRTRKQNLACLACGQCGARTHTRHSGEMIECSRNSALNRSTMGAAFMDSVATKHALNQMQTNLKEHCLF